MAFSAGHSAERPNFRRMRSACTETISASGRSFKRSWRSKSKCSTRNSTLSGDEPIAMNAAFTESLNTQVIRSPNALLKRWRGFELVFFRRRVRIRHEFVEGICQLGLPLLGEVHFACAIWKLDRFHADVEDASYGLDFFGKSDWIQPTVIYRGLSLWPCSFASSIATLTCTGVLINGGLRRLWVVADGPFFESLPQ